MILKGVKHKAGRKARAAKAQAECRSVTSVPQLHYGHCDAANETRAHFTSARIKSMFHPKEESFNTLQIQVVIACKKEQLNINDRTNNKPDPFAVPFLSLRHALQNVLPALSEET